MISIDLHEFIFICVVRDEALYLGKLIDSMEKLPLEVSWKLFVVDDNSNDGTWEILTARGDRNPVITVSNSPGRGKIQAIAHAITLVKEARLVGSALVRFVDGDDYFDTDLLVKEIISITEFESDKPTVYQADIQMVDETTQPIGTLVPVEMSQFFKAGLIPPKASWYLPWEILQKFPTIQLYHGYEDFWITCQLANHLDFQTHPIRYGAYKYRQHPNQVYAPTHRTTSKKQFRSSRLIFALLGTILHDDISETTRVALKKIAFGYMLGVSIRYFLRLQAFNPLAFIRGLLRS